MKTTKQRALSIILVLVMVFSLVATFPLTASAATYSYNSGTRGEVCTALSAQAKAYYTGSYTYANLSKQSGTTLQENLKTLMTSTQTKVTSYAELRTLSAYSDATAGSSSRMTLLYSSDSISNAWDNGVTWNREHVWPQSLGTFTTSNCGSDLHHLRPADSKVNSTRGNLPYGVVTNTSGYKTALSASGTTAGYYTSSYYEPLDNVKGDIARILLYVYVRWGETNLTKVVQSTDVLLSWCASDPVDTWEMGRNDVVQSIEGNRNVFIDYPEYAWLIFNKSVPSGITTPSGNSGSGSSESSGGSSDGSSATYTLVTSASQLTAGSTVVIASSAYNYAMSGAQSNNNRARAAVVKSGNTLSFNGGVGEFTLKAGTKAGTYSFYDAANGGYLYAASSTGNYLRTQASLTANSSWEISVTSAGVATVTAQGTSTRNAMKYNAINGLFSCYATAQTPLALYVKSTNAGTGSGSSGGGSTTYQVSWGKASASTGSGTIKVTANGTAITSGSSVAAGSTIKVTLTPASGSKVSSLTVNGTAVTVSSNSYSFTLSKNTSMAITWGSTAADSSGSTGDKLTYQVSWGKASVSTGSGTIKVTANGTTISSGASVAAGSTIKVVLTPASGSKVSSLTVNGAAVAVSSNSYSFTLSKNTSLLVTWGTSGSSSSTGTTYTKLTSAPTDWTGDYVIVGLSGSTYYVLNANANTTGTTLGSTSGSVTLSSAGIAMSGNTLSNVPTNYVYTCKKSGSYYYFKMKNSGNYLAYKASGLTTATTYTGDTTLWSLTISAGAVTMKSKSNTSYRLCFNTSAKMFRCYSNNTYKLYFFKAS